MEESLRTFLESPAIACSAAEITTLEQQSIRTVNDASLLSEADLIEMGLPIGVRLPIGVL